MHTFPTGGGNQSVVEKRESFRVYISELYNVQPSQSCQVTEHTGKRAALRYSVDALACQNVPSGLALEEEMPLQVAVDLQRNLQGRYVCLACYSN